MTTSTPPVMTAVPPAEPALAGYEAALREAARNDDRVLVLTAENRAAIRHLPALLGPRFIDFGICEQTMVGAAAGLALRGRIPVAHALATFLTLRAFEFIRTDVGIAGLPVKLVGGVPGFLSEANGPTHQAIEDVALMRGIPGMQIVCPCDEDELVAALPEILASPQPTYIRYVAGPARVTHREPFAFGRAEQLADGHHVTLVSYGFLVPEVLAAAAHLAARGIAARVLNLRTLAPVDEAALLEAARETGAIVTIEDHFVTGGLFSITAELFVRHGVATAVVPIALEDRWFRPALLADVLRTEGFTAVQLAARVARALDSLGLHPPDSDLGTSTCTPGDQLV
jgi:transketolase